MGRGLCHPPARPCASKKWSPSRRRRATSTISKATPAEGTTYRSCPRGQEALSGHFAGRHAGCALLHQFQPAARRLHRRPLRGTSPPGAASVPLQPVARCCTSTSANECLQPRPARSWFGRSLEKFPAALHHGDADLLDLPQARLHRRRTRILPDLRRRKAGRKTRRGRVTFSIQEIQHEQAAHQH